MPKKPTIQRLNPPIKTEKYDAILPCENCDKYREGRDTYKIPKGMTVEKYLSTAICSFCGCRMKPPTDEDSSNV